MWKQWWISDKSSTRRESSTRDLRAELRQALGHGRTDHALELYELIEAREPDEPRWSHRKGDLLHRVGRKDDALQAYEHAAHLYAAKGFDALAVATAKYVLTIDPNRHEVLERVNRMADHAQQQRYLVEVELGMRHPD